MNYLIYNKIIIETQISGDVELLSFSAMSHTNSILNLTGTANIVIPAKNILVRDDKLLFLQEDGRYVSVNTGDKITIKYDYYRNDNEKTELEDNAPVKFIGYIRQFNKNEELIDIMIDNSMYLLKNKKFKNSYNVNTNLEQIIESILGFYNASSNINISLNGSSTIQDINLGQVRTDGYMTGASFLQKLIDEYNIYFYTKIIDEEVYLYGGLKYGAIVPLTDVADFTFPYSENAYAVIDNNIEYDKTIKEDDLIVIGKSKTRSSIISLATVNGVDTFDSEDPNYETELNRKTIIEINIPELTSDTLSKLVLDRWNNQDSGFKGGFSTFASPNIIIGDSILLTIDGISERHYIDEITTSINPTSGLTREVTLGAKI